MDPFNKLTATEIHEVFTAYTPSGKIMHTVDRRWCGFIYTISGKTLYRFDGKTLISDPDHILFAPRGASYEIERIKSGLFAVVNFSCAEDITGNELIRLDLDNPSVFLREERLIEKMKLSETPRSHAESMAAFYRMVLCLLPNFSDNGVPPVLKPALDLLETHFSDAGLSVETLAASCGISEVYFRRLFVRSIGMPPIQYLQQLRLNAARASLLRGDRTVTEIAQECGYSSVYHFCRIFKNKCGCTPTEYRSITPI